MLQAFYLQTVGFLILALVISPPLRGETSAEKHRIIVTTDITNEPDDQESMVRLLAYANDYDIEGLIGSTGIWKLSHPATEVIHECIDAYGKVRDNLLLHDANYPTAEYLHQVTVTGNAGYGMSSVGFRGSKGADLIIEAVDKDDPRPVWLLAWGGANTIAQAIWTVQHQRSPEELANFISKIRVYDLAGQDDAGAWMANTFPSLFYIRNVLAYKGMSFRFSSKDWEHTRGGDETVVTRAWVKDNIQQDHGPLGQMYPDALHIWEGDTPTYFYLMPNGLSDPEKQWYGGWGGRFGREKSKNANVLIQEYAGADCSKGCWVNEEPYLDYWMYTDATDKWEYEDKIYENQYCPIFRWRTAFQNDFAARMDWCIKDFQQANHNPVAIVNQDQSKDILYLNVEPGSSVKLDAKDSNDPDGDQLNYHWWVYHEAGSYGKNVAIKKEYSPKTSVVIPEDAKDTSIHLVLTLSDNGTPALTSYRRIILKVK